jgi:hypothetical protein
MNELQIRAKALQWYLMERRGDPRIPDPYTDEGQARLRVLCVYQASAEPDFKDDSFGSRVMQMIRELRPEGAGRDWNLVHGWHDPEDVRNAQCDLWSPYWESVYRDGCSDERRLKREGFETRAKLVGKVLTAIEEAFPQMVTHMKDRMGVKR